MDLTLSDEQLMLRDSAERFVRDCSGAKGRDPVAIWQQFAELGWLALPLPESYGGLEGSAEDINVLLEQFGRGLLKTPYVSTVVLSSGLIAAVASPEKQASILPGVGAGHRRLAFAHVEPGPRGGPSGLKSQAVSIDSGLRLNGTKIAVLDGEGADTLIVSARLEQKTALFLVPRNTHGVSIVGYSLLGGGGGANVNFEDVALPAEAQLVSGDMADAIERVTDAAITASCAEVVGMMAALLDATNAYVNIREQFGKPLSTNQSVRFKLADMAVAVEEARSMALRAAIMLTAPTRDRIRAVAGAKASIGRGARLVAELAIQLHGAMGVTEELNIGGYYKGVLAFEAMFGGIEHQLVRHARASGRLTAERQAT